MARQVGNAGCHSPPYKGGVAPASGDGVVLSTTADQRGVNKHSPPYEGGVAPASGDGVVLPTLPPINVV